MFDTISANDLIMAFFPCIYFSDMSEILHTWGAYPGKTAKYATDRILERSQKRQEFYSVVIKMLAIAKDRGLRLVMENPWGMHSYLQKCFVTPPTLIDKDRTLRGDIFRKPTAYWFINCEPTYGLSLQQKHKALRVKKDVHSQSVRGMCNIERSMITQDYARNFICDFLIGKDQKLQITLF